MVIDSGKTKRPVFVKKDGDREKKRTFPWVHSNGNTLAISRNTGKTFHRFPSFHPFRVTPKPRRLDSVFTGSNASLSTRTARKNTRWRMKSFRAKFSSKWDIPVPSLVRSSRVIQSEEVSVLPIFPVYKVWGGGRFPFEKFPSPRNERERERERNLAEFFVNWIVSRSTSRVT